MTTYSSTPKKPLKRDKKKKTKQTFFQSSKRSGAVISTKTCQNKYDAELIKGLMLLISLVVILIWILHSVDNYLVHSEEE